MDNSKPNLPEPGIESQSQPEPVPGSEYEAQPIPEAPSNGYVNERIKQVYDRAKSFVRDAKEQYRQSPRLQKISHQGKYLPAFWTVACIFSLIVNIVLLAILISFGRQFFALKSLVSESLTEASNSLGLMDSAHIVTTVPVETTVRVQDNLPVIFNLPIDQNTQLLLAQQTRITGAYIYLNGTAVTTDLTLPANTALQVNFNMNIPVSTTVPMNIVVPVSEQVPVDIAVNKTDLHQSIVGLQGAIEPFKVVTGSLFNSPKDISLCNHWSTGWLCGVFLGK